MKKIVLIGDSIRLGYDKYIKESLSGVAEVLSPAENCRFAQHVFRFLGDWKKAGNWGDDVDIVHWNVGLWDVLRLYGDTPLTPIELYADLIAFFILVKAYEASETKKEKKRLSRVIAHRNEKLLAARAALERIKQKNI